MTLIESSIKIKIIIKAKKNTAPYFEKKLIDITLFYEDSLDYELPKIIDD